MNGFNSFEEVYSLTVSQRAFFTVSKEACSPEKLNPAASLCPPKPANISAFALITSYKGTPSILLAEHLYSIYAGL